MTQLQRERALNLERQSAIYEQQTKIAEALQCAEEALVIRKEYVNIPNNYESQRELALCFERCSHLYETQGNADTAMEYLEIAKTIREQMHANKDNSSPLSNSNPQTSESSLATPNIRQQSYLLIILGVIVHLIIWPLSYLEWSEINMNDIPGLVMNGVNYLYNTTNKLFIGHPFISFLLGAIVTVLASWYTYKWQKTRFYNLKKQNRPTSGIKAYLSVVYVVVVLSFAGILGSTWVRYYYTQQSVEFEATEDRFFSYKRTGDMQYGEGNWAGAMENFEQSLEIAEQLLEYNPDDPKWQRNISISYDSIGEVMLAQNDLDNAMENFQKSLEIAEKLAKRNPRNSELQRDLSISYRNLGKVLLRQQDKLSIALENFEQSLEIAEQLVATDRQNDQWQRDLSISYRDLGEVLVEQGDTENALRKYEQSLEIAERLVAMDPQNDQWQYDLSVVYNYIGSAHHKQNNLQDAKKYFEKDLEIAEWLNHEDPQNVQWQHNLITSYMILDEVDPNSNWDEKIDEILEKMDEKQLDNLLELVIRESERTSGGKQ